MANIKIAQLTNKTSLSNTDLVIIESATSTNKMTIGNLKSLLGISKGGVVESGSNANGNYIKFEDGTMICSNAFNVDLTGLSWTAMGSLYRWATPLPDFPQPFISAPNVTKTILRYAGNYPWLSGSADADSATRPSWVQVVVPTNATLTLLRLSYIAIGRWK